MRDDILGRFFGKVPPGWDGCGCKIWQHGMEWVWRGAFWACCMAAATALDECQPPVGAPHVCAAGPGGRPTARPPVRLDVVVVEYRHAECQRFLLVYASGIPEAARDVIGN